MKNVLLLIVLLFLITLHSYAQSVKTPGGGEIVGPLKWKSQIYPGTERDYWVYIPKGYDATKPACIMVVQDGLSRATGWKLPAVLDSLIAARQVPFMIGIFIDHGKVPTSGNDNYPRYNRSLEYDGMGDRYSRFLMDEILPDVSKTYNISSDPNDRSIAGASSGAICAFNVAWERPDQFRRVLSTIGTYVGLRGADEFATLVRKTEPKPLRVFLEDGDHDLNIYAGDWWSANQNMLSALTWNSYEVNHAWGQGGHDSKHAVTILADALVWLWKDYPSVIQTHRGTSPRINPTIAGQNWKEIKLAAPAGQIAVNPSGEVYFTAGQNISRLDAAGNVSSFASLKGVIGGIGWSADGKLYVGDLTHNKVVEIDARGNAQDVISRVHAGYLTVSTKGIYFTETKLSRIGFYSFSSKKIQYTTVVAGPVGLAISADQTLISVGLSNGVFGYSYQIGDDGHLDFGQEYIHYHVPYGATSPAPSGMTVDTENLLYTSTPMGIQLSDQLGRVNFIFSKPMGGSGDVKLGGADLSTLYISVEGKIFSRKIAAKGALPFMSPVKPPKPGM